MRRPLLVAVGVALAAVVVLVGLRLTHQAPAHRPNTTAPQSQHAGASGFVDQPQPAVALTRADLDQDGSRLTLDPFASPRLHRWTIIGKPFAREPTLLTTSDDGAAALLIHRSEEGDLRLVLLLRDPQTDWPWRGSSSAPEKPDWATVRVDGGIPFDRYAVIKAMRSQVLQGGPALTLGAPALEIVQPAHGCRTERKLCAVPFDTAVVCGSQVLELMVGLRLSSRTFGFDLRNAPRTALSLLQLPGQSCP